MKIVRITSKVFLFFSLFILCFLFWNPLPVLAHRPHDVISQVELSPTYTQDQTVFIIVREQFLKSTDGGKSWERVVNGIDNENYFSSLAISHQNNQILFLSSLGDGIYKTENGGNAWFKVNNGFTNLKIDTVKISPFFDEIVLASGDNVLYQTIDGGENWQPVMQAGGLITAIAFSPIQKDIFLVGDQQGNVYSTLDQGFSWQQIAALPNRDLVNTAIGSAVNALAISSDRIVFIGTEHHGIFKTTLEGESLQEINQGLIDPKIRDIAIALNEKKDSFVFISTWDEGVFKSEDGGKSWQQSSKGLIRDVQADTAQFREPHFRMIRLSHDFSKDTTMYLAGFSGLFKSTNGGKQWKELETLSTRVIVALDVSPNHVRDGTVVFGTYEQEAYISHNRGKTWESILDGLSILKHNSSLKSSPVLSPAGILTQDAEKKDVWEIEPPRFYDVLFSPNYASDKTLFASLLYKFFHTSNNGWSWKRTPLPIVPETNDRDIFIAASPNYDKDSIIYAATKYGGAIYQSKDGGKKFTAIGKVDDSITAFAVSPNFASDQTLFAITSKGVQQSTDQGRTWKNVTQSSSLRDAQWLTLTISPNYQADRTVLVGTNQGIVQTKNAGVTWTRLESTPYSKDAFIEAIAMSPDYKNDQTFISGVRGHGLFKTTDGGQTFNQIGKDLIQKNYPFSHMVMSASVPIQFSPTYVLDKTLYGFGSAKTEVYRSSDAGETWNVLFIPRQFDVRATFFDYTKLIKLIFHVDSSLKILASTIAALFTYFLLRALPLTQRFLLKRWQFKSGGSLLAFIALWLLLSLS